jgi:hypothetical protein
VGRSPRRRALCPLRQRARVVLVPRRSGSHEARIRAGGVEQDVTLTETGEVNDELDNAYRTKYGRYAANIIDRITSPDARAATLELVPT